MPHGDVMLPYIQAEQVEKIYGDGELGVRSGDVVLDCGANVGMFTKTALAAGARLVVAIEPAPATLECLRRNLAAEIKQGQVSVYAKGVWDRDGVLPLSVDRTNPGGNSFVLDTKDKEVVNVPLTTIDELVLELKLPRVDFIKMDIEGAEKNALRGGRQILLRFRPRLAISAEHLADDGTAIPALVRSLQPRYRERFGRCLYQPAQTQAAPEVLFFY
jgi:FkbM family methyltransferase